MSKTYGYARVSRSTQKVERQIENIAKAYPNAIIKHEAYTGTKVEGRKEFEKLLNQVEAGDTIVFDSVSRMSRNADDGVNIYFYLLEKKKVNLVFLKEPHINTEVYETSKNQSIKFTGDEIADCYIEATNKVLKILAKKQIRIAFEQAQKEVDDLHERTKEGMREAKRNGKQIGQVLGKTLNVKKKEPAKAEIRRLAKAFGGANTDMEVMKLTGLSRNTYYKYKKEITLELLDENNIESIPY